MADAVIYAQIAQKNPMVQCIMIRVVPSAAAKDRSQLKFGDKKALQQMFEEHQVDPSRWHAYETIEELAQVDFAGGKCRPARSFF